MNMREREIARERGGKTDRQTDRLWAMRKPFLKRSRDVFCVFESRKR